MALRCQVAITARGCLRLAYLGPQSDSEPVLMIWGSVYAIGTPTTSPGALETGVPSTEIRQRPLPSLKIAPVMRAKNLSYSE